ncbi:MAG TPA: ATP-binding cassette domain-containing protein [Candidatus Absconditabacterales bacterium]|nr:ATP-binding cassette domain-containing protein [Candidatus Absconditabacterales bacterium]
MEKNMPLIEIKNLSRGYRDNPMPLFEKLSLTLNASDFFVLTGKSGAGKTTLVKFITGKLVPPEKTIFYNNQDISTFTKDDIQILRKRSGIIFQDYQLLEDLNVRENIVYPLHLYEIGETIIESKLKQVLQKIHIKHLLDTPVKLLSSGEKQRVALARALIHDPEVIIADEPTGNLDRENTQIVADILIQANKEGNTIFLITHDIHLLNYLKAKHSIKLHIIK